MYKLGITGGIGSGKTTAANFFRKMGAIVFDADVEAKNHLQNTISLQHQIISAFGNKVTTNNKLDLKKLAEAAFATTIDQKILNGLIWPEIYLIKEKALSKAVNLDKKLFVVDAALLLEADSLDFYDKTLLITAEKPIRLHRATLRKNISVQQIKKRMALQMAESEKRKLVDFTIENDNSIGELIKNLEKFYKSLKLG